MPSIHRGSRFAGGVTPVTKKNMKIKKNLTYYSLLLYIGFMNDDLFLYIFVGSFVILAPLFFFFVLWFCLRARSRFYERFFGILDKFADNLKKNDKK